MQPPFEVVRVAGYDMPQQVSFIALHNDYAEAFCPSTTLPEDECGKIVIERLLRGDRGHYGPLEHAHLTLALRADHNTMMQLRTHRVGLTYDYQSMRYTGARIEKVATCETPVEDVFYIRPPGKYRDRQGDPYEWTVDDAEEHLAISLSSAMDYKRFRDKGFSEEHSRGVLTTNYFQNGVVTGNIRSWFHLMDVRLKRDAQSEFRWLMELVAGEVQRWVPEVYGWYQEHRLGKARLAP